VASPTPRFVASPDGTPIALFEVAAPAAIEPEAIEPGPTRRPVPDRGRPTLLLVHGTAADHTTWRVSGPLLASSRPVFAIDRRGRGESGDGPAYSIEREYQDLAAVAEQLASERGGAVDVAGHSFGGRVALGAALLSAAIRRVVAYEGAPTHVRRGRTPRAAIARLEADLAAGRPEHMLDSFLRAVVGFDAAGLAAYHANPVWPDRVAAAERTLLRELRAEGSPEAGLARLGAVRQPVLLILGERSPAFFRRGNDRLAARLGDAAVVEIAGAAHAAHHSHADDFVRAVTSFLDH
jgi:pimeloyl-ACP methyl ester carboxylesterase